MEESVQLWRDLGDKREMALATTHLGNSHSGCSERAKGRGLLEQSVAISRELDKWCLAKALWGLGDIALQQCDIIAAREADEECIDLCRELGDRLLMAHALRTQSVVMCAQGEPEKGRSLMEESLAINWELKDELGITDCLRILGVFAFYAGDYSAAAELLKATLKAYQQSGVKKMIAWALGYLGAVARRQGDEVRFSTTT